MACHRRFSKSQWLENDFPQNGSTQTQKGSTQTPKGFYRACAIKNPQGFKSDPNRAHSEPQIGLINLVI